jgi:hypothetical protein
MPGKIERSLLDERMHMVDWLWDKLSDQTSLACDAIKDRNRFMMMCHRLIKASGDPTSERDWDEITKCQAELEAWE